MRPRSRRTGCVTAAQLPLVRGLYKRDTVDQQRRPTSPTPHQTASHQHRCDMANPVEIEKRETATIENVHAGQDYQEQAQVATHEVNERALLRKIDWHLVPVRSPLAGCEAHAEYRCSHCCTYCPSWIELMWVPLDVSRQTIAHGRSAMLVSSVWRRV